MPYLCQTLGKLVGVAGFEPATPSSRTMHPWAKPLIGLESKWRKYVNKAGNDTHFCAEAVQASLKVAARVLPLLSAEDRAALLPYVKRDMARFAEMTEQER